MSVSSTLSVHPKSRNTEGGFRLALNLFHSCNNVAKRFGFSGIAELAQLDCNDLQSTTTPYLAELVVALCTNICDSLGDTPAGTVATDDWRPAGNTELVPQPPQSGPSFSFRHMANTADEKSDEDHRLPFVGSVGSVRAMDFSIHAKLDDMAISTRPARQSTRYHLRRATVMMNIAHQDNDDFEPDVMETSNAIVGRDEDDNKTINNYVVLGEIGRGSFGKVKIAENLKTSEIVAMKIIRMDHFGSATAAQELVHRQRIQREIAVMKRVAHPNLVRLHEVIRNPASSKIYLVMDYIPNGVIAVKTSAITCHPISLDTLSGYAVQIVQGLRALHKNGIFHRDIKPDNILLGEGGKVYLSDFGVSVICAEDGVEGVEGTPAFMAPELCRGDAIVKGDLVDVWALGVTFFQLAFGELPFIADSPLQLTRKIVNAPVEFPTGRNVPAEFREVIRGMLEKDPSKRMTLSQLLQSKWLHQKDITTELSEGTLQVVQSTSGDLRNQDSRSTSESSSPTEKKTPTRPSRRNQTRRRPTIQDDSESAFTLLEEEMITSPSVSKRVEELRRNVLSSRAALAVKRCQQAAREIVDLEESKAL